MNWLKFDVLISLVDLQTNDKKPFVISVVWLTLKMKINGINDLTEGRVSNVPYRHANVCEKLPFYVRVSHTTSL